MSEDFRILVEDIIDFLNGVETSCVTFRKQIEKLLGSEAKAGIPEDRFNVLRWSNSYPFLDLPSACMQLG